MKTAPALTTRLPLSPEASPLREASAAKESAPAAATGKEYRAQGEVAPKDWPQTDARALPRKHLVNMTEGGLAGFEKPAVMGAMLAVVALPGVVHAAPLDATPVGAPVDPSAAGGLRAPGAAAEPRTSPEYQQAMRDLDVRFEQGTISQADLAKARRFLTDALVEGKRDVVVPRDFRGRIDLDAVITQASTRATPISGRAVRSRGEAVMERLTNELDRRMRITARDMADPNMRVLEGAPGYKESPAADVQKLLLDAVEDIPLNELQGGEQIARLVRSIPNAEGLDAEHMSLREIKSRLTEVERDWLKDQIRPLIAGHETEVGIAAFAAVTGLRAASPAAAGFIDKLGLRTTIYHHTFDEGRADVRARAVYRDRHVLPDIDVDVGASRVVAPGTTLRATVGGTLSVEAKDLLTGTATVGAHHTNGNFNADASATYYSNTERLRTNVTISNYNPDTRTSTALSATGMFGDGTSVGGKANGRATLEVDVTRDLNLGHGITGEAGVFAGGSVDTDGSHPDARVGAVLRLRW